MNDADFELLNKQINNESSERPQIDLVATLELRIYGLRAELERVVIDNHLLREENERLRRQRPEEQR